MDGSAASRRYFIDCEFDGHNGPLLSMAIVRDDGHSIHIETTETARDPWVIANVVPLMGENDATTHPLVPLNWVGSVVADFLIDDMAPIIVADSPVDIARFCAAISTNRAGRYEPCIKSRFAFEVHDVDCYPTDLSGAVQHNAWWDAMALRQRLTGAGL